MPNEAEHFQKWIEIIGVIKREFHNISEALFIYAETVPASSLLQVLLHSLYLFPSFDRPRYALCKQCLGP